jgi:hypothetical protein
MTITANGVAAIAVLKLMIEKGEEEDDKVVDLFIKFERERGHDLFADKLVMYREICRETRRVLKCQKK